MADRDIKAAGAPEAQAQVVSPRNKLNELTNREWLRRTKSVWYSGQGEGPEAAKAAELARKFSRWVAEEEGYEAADELMGQAFPSVMVSVAPPRDALKVKHPATFSEVDVARLITFFTKRGQTVLDPFCGSGSAGVAALEEGRRFVGVELISEWHELACARLCEQTGGRKSARWAMLLGDARKQLGVLEPESVDFVVTSPPYWNILRKQGIKARVERQELGLATQYSEDDQDLGNCADYGEFLTRVADILELSARALKAGRYMAVIVSDFREKSRFVLFHSDLAACLEERELLLQGVTVLVQDSKGLYPYGVPNAFVPNVHHQYVLILRKPAR